MGRKAERKAAEEHAARLRDVPEWQLRNMQKAVAAMPNDSFSYVAGAAQIELERQREAREGS